MKFSRYISLLFSVGVFMIGLQSCGRKDDQKKTLFVRMDSTETGIGFLNAVIDREDFNIFSYRNYYNGGGVALGDINNDGLADIYFTANMKKNKLYLNKGNWKFEDITLKAGVEGKKSWSTGVTMADINGDGYLDIYVCNSGDQKGDNKENELFINNGDLTFTEKAAEVGLNDRGFSTHSSFFDYDLDGDLDCYILNNSFKAISRVEQFYIKRDERDSIGGHKLLRNDKGHFVDVSTEAGIYGSWIGFGLGVSVSDINEDMLPDIYISNDFWERDYLYINKGDGTFAEELTSRTSVISTSSMGADVADLNNDGYPEIFTTDMLPGDNTRIKTMTKFDETNIKELKVRSSYHYQYTQNCLQFNDGDGHFQELAFMAGTAATDWSWGSLIFDMDNNGWKDIFVSNGMYRDITSLDFSDFVTDRENIRKAVEEKGKFDYKDLLDLLPTSELSNYAFVNQKNKTFKNLADSLGLGEVSYSNGAAYGDLDNDGDMDLVVNNVNMPSFVYRNTSDTLIENNYLKVKFKGPKNNGFGIGAKVTAYTKEGIQTLQNFTARGFESSVEPQLLFGLGTASMVDSLRIVWPDLKMQVVKNIKSNQVFVADYAFANLTFKKERKKIDPLFNEVSASILKGNYVHHENNFNDFDYERLLPKKISTEGPEILTGDLNGDKLDDFMLLGAYGDPDKLFFQQQNGQFQQQHQSVFLADSVYESTCGIFIDGDNDGDNDIFIGSGGNEFGTLRQKSHVLRYYENNGVGIFKRSDKGPVALGNLSVIKANDFDNDGDADLFLGARIIPGNYGLVPHSFLFRNDNGAWTDVTPSDLGGAGMITDAIWSDLDADKYDDLIMVGDWMPVKIFRGNGKSFEAAITIPGTEGWWTAIEQADLNNDGKNDLILGNWGLNSKFKASTTKPLTMFVKDFDQNGKSEFVINWYPPLDNKSVPFAAKLDLTSQLPFLKKKSLTYNEYAKKDYTELFNEDVRKGAIEYKATYLESAVLWNHGAMKFVAEALPLEAQVSPVFAIHVGDLDGDAHTDLLLCGNLYGLKPEVGRQDSNKGVVLKGDGHGKFAYVPASESGITISGEVRDVKLLRMNGKSQAILVGRNNNSALIFKRK